MHDFLRFMASTKGRVFRIAAGTTLIGVGLLGARKNWGLAALGTLPLAMGATDSCLLGPINGLPFAGPKMRAAIK
jgi:hypothetical protein